MFKRSREQAARRHRHQQAQQVAHQVAHGGEEETLAVLEDMDTGTEFYMDILETFELDGHRYVALFPMADKRSAKTPSLVILRVIQGDGQPGQTLYESIRDRKELDRAFEVFFALYEKSLFTL